MMVVFTGQLKAKGIGFYGLVLTTLMCEYWYLLKGFGSFYVSSLLVVVQLDYVLVASPHPSRLAISQRHLPFVCHLCTKICFFLKLMTVRESPYGVVIYLFICKQHVQVQKDEGVKGERSVQAMATTLCNEGSEDLV
jgi:uncharacterized membrane protein